MHFHFHHLVGMRDGLRLLYRTRHIFILFSGLLNFMLAAYVIARPRGWRRILQWFGSTLVIIASVLLVTAFVYDTTRGDLLAPFSHWGVILIALGTLSHLISGASARSTGD